MTVEPRLEWIELTVAGLSAALAPNHHWYQRVHERLYRLLCSGNTRSGVWLSDNTELNLM